MVEIINGPGLDILKRTSEPKRIIFELKNRITQQMTISNIKLLDGGKITFTTEKGEQGFYNAKTKMGSIKPATITSETAPEIGVQSI